MPSLTDEEQLVIYRVTQESLSNIAQHANASHVRVQLSFVGRTILRISDDGAGFDPGPGNEGRNGRPRGRVGGLGLSGMRERALLIGGNLALFSAPSEGTTIELTMGANMKILIADDHGIVRGGLRLLIDRQPDMEVVAEAEDGIDAFEQALATKPDLCVMDVSMPRMTGLQAAREIRSHMPDTQVLVLSMHDDERYVFDALKAGASGYVLKREVDHALLGAIRAVHRGEAFLTTAVERSLIRDWMSDDRAGPDEPLTPREQEVLKLIAEAHTNKQIAEILHLAEKTVESHRANLLRKLGMRDRVELVRYAIRRGLTEACPNLTRVQTRVLYALATLGLCAAAAVTGVWIAASSGEEPARPAERVRRLDPPARRPRAGLPPPRPGRQGGHDGRVPRPHGGDDLRLLDLRGHLPRADPVDPRRARPARSRRARARGLRRPAQRHARARAALPARAARHRPGALRARVRATSSRRCGAATGSRRSAASSTTRPTWCSSTARGGSGSASRTRG